MQLWLRRNKSVRRVVSLLAVQKKLEDNNKDPDMLLKVNKANMALVHQLSRLVTWKMVASHSGKFTIML